MKPFRTRILVATFYVALSLAPPVNAEQANPLLVNMEAAFAKGQWNEAAEISYEILSRTPDQSQARIKLAYSLFQKGYANAALMVLKRLDAKQWAAMPEGQDRLIEIVALFQKKVPLNVLPGRIEQVNPDETSAYLRDEVRFGKGRALFEKKAYAEAKKSLLQVSKNSRFYGPASYLLGTIAVNENDYKQAATEYSKIFEPQVYEQGAEFWKDIGTQLNSHWGNTLNVQVDTQVLSKSSGMGELALIALARTAYGSKDFNSALTRYDQISRESPFFARARLEKVWTLLALNQHEEAQKEAATLFVEGASFESLEARPVRALILADEGHTQEAREEIERFYSVYETAKTALTRFRQYPNPTNLPSFTQTDLKSDERIKALDAYQVKLKEEIAALRAEDRRFFPVFATLSSELEPLISQARELSAKLTDSHIGRRLADLERLYVQAKLIVAETYLEDREKLRNEFRNAGSDLERQKQHDQKLVNLLGQAVKEVDEATKNVKERHLHLEFRQSELLWELSSATAILSQTTNKEEDRTKADAFRNRSIQIAKDIADHFPKFTKHAQAMFFVGFAQLEVDKPAEGIENLRKFVATYPDHSHVPDAYRILADIEFDANRFKTAAEYYQKILAFQNSSIVGYALYKMAWCNYNLKNFAKAILGLEQAVLWAKSLESTDQLLNLKREARRDLISIFAEFGDPKKALEYFDRFLGGDSASWLADLAKQYEETGQFEKSMDLYRQLLSLDVQTPDKIGYQTAIIRDSYKLRKWETTFDATKELVGAYSTVLQPVQAKDTPAWNAEKDLNETIMTQHYEFQNAELPADINRVLEMDKLYLQAFGAWPSSEAPLYQYAHYLLKNKRNSEAVDAFRTHWQKFQETLKEPLREEALRNLVHALEEFEGLRKEGADKPTKIAEELLQMCAEYVKLYPKTKHNRAIAFLRTAILFKYQQSAEGIAESQKIFDAGPTDDFGKRAFKNLRVAYYDQKNWEKTFNWASEMRKRADIEKSIFAPDLKAVREESLFLWADNTADNLAAAALYLKIAADANMERLREKALHNAFIRYQKADKKVEALQTAIQLEKVAPTFKELSGIAGIRAAFYQEAGDYEQALPLFEAFLKKPAADIGPEIVQQARLNSALISEAVQKFPQATALYKAYLETAGTAETPGTPVAKRGIERIEKRSKREPAAVFKKWDALVALRADLDKAPLPKGKDLAGRIQGGAQKLEKVVRQFLDASGNEQTPAFFAFESYCTVPFLYGAYQKGIRSLGDGQPPELMVELEKLASPLDAKAKEVADECINKSGLAFHDGPLYRQVIAKWGWASDAITNDRATKMLAELNKKAPFVDPAPSDQNEPQILALHLQGHGTPDTWYALAKIRFDTKRHGLSRLTLIDALGKSPGSGRILNLLAVIENYNNPDPVTLSILYEKAGAAGSGLAFTNLALIHLKQGRLVKALEVLKEANEKMALENFSEIKILALELSQRLAPPPVAPPLPITADGKESDASDKKEAEAAASSAPTENRDVASESKPSSSSSTSSSSSSSSSTEEVKPAESSGSKP